MNSLHIYSAICRLHISKEKALKAAKTYEKVIHPIIYFKI